MIKALSTHHNRKLSFVFLMACCILATGAGLIGIDDNAPGIFCAFGVAAALVYLSLFTHGELPDNMECCFS